ncbi:unnamed protein product [Rotaria sp. Silwood1]|nr:unnamed protein product [Rotaria sp. Silwood1]
MLRVNPQVLQAQAQLGGKDLIPFYKLLEDGREGEIYREMEDLFYYSQLRFQDINQFDRREVTRKIPLSEITFVMKAFGYYPTEQEIEEILNEVKFSTYVETNINAEHIDLNDFIKCKHGQLQINHENLLFLLQQYDEHMNNYEMADCLSNLCHLNSVSTEMFDTMNAYDACQFIENQLPDQVTLQHFYGRFIKNPITIC